MKREQEEQAIRQARLLAERGRWAEAATLYQELAESAAIRGERETCQQAWALAGDALRRDDRPAAAARALARAIDMLDTEDASAVTRKVAACTELVGVLVQAGSLLAATSLSRESVALSQTPAERTLALDTMLSVLLARGMISDLQGPLDELDQIAPPGARPAVRFWRGRLARLQGRYREADQFLIRVIRAMRGSRAAEGPIAAALLERGEIALLFGDGQRAGDFFAEAGRRWTTAGRRSGVFQAEAGLVRASIERGETPLAAALRGAVEFASVRDMPLLEAELRIARGAARARAGMVGGEPDFACAIQLAESCGAKLIEGNARIQRRRSGFHHGDMERIKICMEGVTAWRSMLKPHRG